MHIAAAVGHADPRPVRPEPGRAIRAVGPAHRRGSHDRNRRDTMFRPGLRPPHHRHADGQPFRRCRRSGGAPALASLGERGGVSAAATVIRRTARPWPARAFPPSSWRITKRRSWPIASPRLGFADEIVVLLDRCTDRSREIAARFTDRIVEGAWAREGPRRQPGSTACRGDWILEIDADERVRPNLAAEIRGVVAQLAGRLAPDPGRQLRRRPAGALGLGRLLRQVRLCRAVPKGRQSTGATTACCMRA